MKQQFLNDSGLTELIGYIKKYVKDDQNVKPYASLSVFPKTGEQNIIYIDTTTNASYYWDDASKTYKALDVQTWANLTGKPSTFPPSTHTHDDRYYTETEMNTKLAAKANSSHTHKKADITDFPTSMPASDVPAWAKAATKPNYTKAEVGLGSVDNTADKDKSVKYATSAGSASTAGSATNATTATMATKLQTYKQGSTTETYGTQYPLYAQWEDSSNARLKVDNYTVKVNYADKAGSATSASSATVADSAKAVAWGNISGKPSTFPPSAHTHTKSEVGLGNVDNTADANKSVKYAVSAGSATTATTASSANAVAWGNVTGKPSTYPASSHTHDDRYYTEGEVNTLLNEKAVNKVLTNEDLNAITTPGFYSAGGGNTVTNKPSDIDNFGLIVIHKASGSYYTQILFYDTVSYRRICANGTWGSWTQDKLTDTNTWRGIQNNLTSDSTTDSLSAAQGKALKTLVDGKSVLGHKHTKSEITNFPTSMPASDVYSWAKASTKPAYSWSEINNKPSTFTPSSHTHGSGDITSLSADKITGVIGIDHLPAGALERCKIVADDTARFKLTKNDVQNGDTVKVGTDANAKMYFVIDDTKLSSEAGYTIYTAGSATSVPWSGVTGKPSTFTPSSHTHDDRYYTESEMNTKLAGKSDTSHSHNLNTMINTLTEGTAAPLDNDYYIAQYAGGGTTTTTYHRRPHSALWSYIKGKADSVYQAKGSYAASSHTHTISQITDISKANVNAATTINSATPTLSTGVEHNPITIKKNANGIFDSTGKHSNSIISALDFAWYNTNWQIGNIRGDSDNSIGFGFAYKLSSDGALSLKSYIDTNGVYHGNISGTATSASTATALTTNAGSATQPVYFSGGKPVATSYTLGASVPAGAKFTDTNTWRGIQNNLTSDSTTDSLSAAQGKALKALVDGKAAASHTHTIANITGLQTALDGKAAASHSHSYAGSSSAGGAATSANAINWVGGNEIRFTKPNYTSAQTLWIGWAWSDSSKLKLINEYKFAGGDGNLTQVTASQFNGSLSGNASSASKLATARTISLTGSVTGSGTFDGSGNLSIATTTNHTHSYAGSSSAGGAANSAVKLSTARSINGTNFDGSGNITTANWGTARTITIGSTGKSVNGSGNVSWSLSEIGAAAASHSHTVGNITGLQGALDSKALNSNTIKGVSANGYWGLATPGSDSATWIRTTSSGLLPYQSGSVGDGHSSIGTSSWYFGSAYIDNVYANQLRGTLPEAYLAWGGKNFSGTYGPIDAAMISDLGANRLAFGAPAGIKIEYSRNSGSTWTDYGASDVEKKNLLSTGGVGFVIGKADNTNKATAAYMLRITLDTDKIPVYSVLNKFALYISTNGSSGSYCTIEASLESNPTTFAKFADKAPISGWSGWNIINTSSFTTYGNSSSSQYGLIRFTFGCTGGSTTYNGLGIYKILGFGGVGWNTPSNMAKAGSIYSYDYAQNTSFPAQVTATQFNGKLNGVATKLARSGDTNYPMTFNWSGQSGQPTWLWGSNNGIDTYVYNPSNFSVKYATSAGSANAVAWANVSGKPSTFAPSAHTHGQYYDSGVSRTANTVLAAPNGSNGGATFRKLVEADIPTLTKSKISDFPGSLPASDVYAWAKASSKPSYTKAEVGLGNVDNTADSAKSVKYATSAGSATSMSNSGALDTVAKLDSFIEAGKVKYATVSALDGLNGMIKNDGICISTPWTSTGYGHQFYINDNGYDLYHRFRNTTKVNNVDTPSWSPWKQILDSNNYNVYVPTKTGGGASGTWGISISGNAATATKATSATSASSASTCTGNAATATALTTSAGSSTQPVYFSGGKPVACSYTISTSVPSGAKFTDTNTWRPLGTTGDTACAGNDSRLSNARPASDVYSWAKASSKPSYSWSEIGSKPSTFTPSSHSHETVTGKYTGNGGQQNPTYISGGTVRFNMMNTAINSDTSYKDFILMDTYTGSDVPYVTALGLSKSSSAKAFIMAGKKGGSTWDYKAELLSTSNYTSYTVTKSGSGASGTWGINVTGSAGSVAWGNVSGRPSSMPASDVYSWAKASSKPSYSWSEISGKPSSLPASDVYAWAKASSKPSYSWSEIGSKPSTFTPSSHTHNYAGSSSAGGNANWANGASYANYAIKTACNPTEDKSTNGLFMFQYSENTTICPDSAWWSVVRTQHAGYNNGYWQEMAYRFDSDIIKFRRNVNGSKSAWKTIAFTDSKVSSAGYADSAGSANSVAWGNVSGKPSTFAPSSHTHSYAGSSSAGGSANSAVKLDTATAGSSTQPVYFTGGKPAACSYTLGKSVPSNAVFTDTNTWRPVVNNLVSTATDQSLSAAQGKTLKDKLDKLTPIGYIFVWSNYKSDGTAISGAPDLSTAEKVAAHFGGGTWARIDGKFLYGYTGTGDYALGKTGGATTVSLSTANLPSHSHSIPALSGSAASAGSHTHTLKYFTDNAVGGKSARVAGNGKETTGSPVVNSAGAHTHTVTTKAGTSGSNGSGTAHNNMPPFMAVYIWQRVA